MGRPRLVLGAAVWLAVMTLAAGLTGGAALANVNADDAAGAMLTAFGSGSSLTAAGMNLATLIHLTKGDGRG